MTRRGPGCCPCQNSARRRSASSLEAAGAISASLCARPHRRLSFATDLRPAQSRAQKRPQSLAGPAGSNGCNRTSAASPSSWPASRKSNTSAIPNGLAGLLLDLAAQALPAFGDARLRAPVGELHRRRRHAAARAPAHGLGALAKPPEPRGQTPPRMLGLAASPHLL